MRQAARRAALEAQSQMKKDRAERERRIGALAIEVMVALGERDAAVATQERIAGEGLRRMIEDEKLHVREIAAWCGESLGTGETRRLLRAAAAGRAGTDKS